MLKNAIILSEMTEEQLEKLFSSTIRSQLIDFKKSLENTHSNDELLTRDEACKFLKINASTLWHWTNKGKVNAFGIGNRRYYKRSQLLECLKPLNK